MIPCMRIRDEGERGAANESLTERECGNAERDFN